jgi:hypothetical protein
MVRAVHAKTISNETQEPGAAKDAFGAFSPLDHVGQSTID